MIGIRSVTTPFNTQSTDEVVERIDLARRRRKRQRQLRQIPAG
jgi:hypothetical protein